MKKILIVLSLGALFFSGCSSGEKIFFTPDIRLDGYLFRPYPYYPNAVPYHEKFYAESILTIQNMTSGNCELAILADGLHIRDIRQGESQIVKVKNFPYENRGYKKVSILVVKQCGKQRKVAGSFAKDFYADSSRRQTETWIARDRDFKNHARY